MGIFEEATDIYNKTGSIKEVSKELNISEQKARKILITKGIKISSDRGNGIIAMYNNGSTIDEISKKLNLSKKYINSYLPYTKGVYNEALSENAKRIKKHRNKN